jgi:hypothetical protein
MRYRRSLTMEHLAIAMYQQWAIDDIIMLIYCPPPKKELCNDSYDTGEEADILLPCSLVL